MATNWQQRLDTASSEAEIVAVTQEFVASLGSDVIERLPQGLQPRRFESASQVTDYALSVVMHRLEVNSAAMSEHIEAIAAFFTHAAGRLTQVTARPHGRR